MSRHPILGNEYDTLSRAERHLLAGMKRRNLRPLVNEPMAVHGVVVRPDFHFVLEQLVVEADGGGHDSPARQAEDVARAELLARIGISTVRYSDSEIWRDVDACLDDLTVRLASRSLRAA